MPPILPYIAQQGSQPGLLFRFGDGSFLTRERFVQEVRQLLASAGIDCTPYSGHSFRIGTATTVAHAGLDAALMQTLGQWKSSAYQHPPRLLSLHHLFASCGTIGVASL